MKTTLLEVAKSIKSKKSYTKEVSNELIELSVAWMNGEVTQGQCAKALGKSSQGEVTSVLYQLCVAIREGMKQGKIKLTYNK